MLQFVINFPYLCNLAVVDRTWNIEESNWNDSIRTKTKYSSDIMVVCPAIVKIAPVSPYSLPAVNTVSIH
jgi:hypothetical protein